MDGHATTRVEPRVVAAMLPYFDERYGNAASRHHRYGWVARDAVAHAREAVARLLGGTAREFVFTSGATESNNLALKGAVALSSCDRRRRRGRPPARVAGGLSSHDRRPGGEIH
jgi:cysteine sulfinate desulfinase/cysteine desulfurase-like protein